MFAENSILNDAHFVKRIYHSVIVILELVDLNYRCAPPHHPAMATTVDGLVADIRKVSEKTELKEIAAKLISQEEELANVELSMLDTMIECLDVSTHSLGVMAAL